MAQWAKVLACCQSQQSEFGSQGFGVKRKQTTVELYPDVHNTCTHICIQNKYKIQLGGGAHL